MTLVVPVKESLDWSPSGTLGWRPSFSEMLELPFLTRCRPMQVLLMWAGRCKAAWINAAEGDIQQIGSLAAELHTIGHHHFLPPSQGAAPCHLSDSAMIAAPEVGTGGRRITQSMLATEVQPPRALRTIS